MAELTLAIAPLCIGAIKGARSLSKTLKALRHSDRGVNRLRTAFDTQKRIFLNEFQLLFQEFMNADLAKELVGDTGHPEWNDELDSKIKSFLGERIEVFQAIVSEIHRQIENLERTLNATTGDALRPDIKLKGLERKREATDFVLAGTTYESEIHDLRQWIQDLKSIRTTAKEINTAKIRSFAKVGRLQQLPISYQQVTQYSSSFYGALVSYWSCLQARHTNHDVRLLLDKHQRDSSFRVAVRYQALSEDIIQDGLLDLVVRSQNIGSLIIEPLPTEGSQEPPTVTRRVRFAGTDVAARTATSLGEGEDMPRAGPHGLANSPGLNLCSCEDMCTQLCTQTLTTGYNKLYLDSPDHVRHYLQTMCGISCDHKACFRINSLGGPVPVDSIFCLPLHKTLSMLDQLRLALRLVKGVLQFQSTPWLRPLWGLRDLSYFQTDAGLAAALDTLHLSTELSRQKQKQADGINIGDDLLEAQLYFGIRNLTMYSLGVALLQIGQWNYLEPGEIVQIRRIANHESPLGPAYQSITQRCLECDFSHRCGKDLAKPELRSAIYRDVVCELEGLIQVLE